MKRLISILFCFALALAAFGENTAALLNRTGPRICADDDASSDALSPVAIWLAHGGIVKDDDESSLNPWVIHVIKGYPVDGSYPYRWEKNEYDIYNGVTETLLYKGAIVAKAHPNKTRCSNCCGLTFEIFFRAMRLRNQRKGLDPDDFNGMTRDDLFNMMLIWFVVGPGDSPREAIVHYGLGRAITDWEQARPGDFMDISRNNGSGHSVIFLEWMRGESGGIEGLIYFSSNSGGVGELTERFSDSGGKVLREHVRIGRVGGIEDYRLFDRAAIPERK